MKQSESSLISGLLRGYEDAEFEREVDAEKEILGRHSHETLLNMAAAMSAYINHVWPIMEREMPIANQAYLNGIKAQKTKQAKSAVSMREDQQLKPDWIDHCMKVKASGAEIRTLADLLNVQGYKPEITKITSITLKKWAGEVGIKFKPGRPKK